MLFIDEKGLERCPKLAQKLLDQNSTITIVMITSIRFWNILDERSMRLSKTLMCKFWQTVPFNTILVHCHSPAEWPMARIGEIITFSIIHGKNRDWSIDTGVTGLHRLLDQKLQMPAESQEPSPCVFSYKITQSRRRHNAHTHTHTHKLTDCILQWETRYE